MLDSDLAELYGVETFRLNERVKRNLNRFPENFMFKLNQEEFNSLSSQFAMLKNKRGKHKKYLPYVFTEQGVAMLSAVLNSQTAIEMSIKIINAFVEMRKFLTQHSNFFQKFQQIDQKLLEHDSNFNKIFNALETEKPKQGIFYDGQIYDAYLFVSNLIKEAKHRIILIDNYIDETILTLFSKKMKM